MTKGEGHQVTLKVVAGPEDLEEILEHTYKDLSTKVKVPGFRKGKVPRAVIDSHLGVEYVRNEAIKNGMPTLYVLGVIESGIEPVSDPEINILDLPDDGGVSFEAKVDVKPEIEVKDYKGIEVDRPDTEVTEDDLQRTLDEARDRFATLEVVEGRPVIEGDFVMFDFKVFTDGVPLEGSSGSDRMTEVGAEDFFPGFDEQLVGARKGDILDVVINFPPDYGEPALAGKPATFRTIIKEIKRKVLPELDDDLAREISNFETMEEFKEDMRERIAKVKETMGERETRQNVVKALADHTYVDLPESMVEQQVDHEIEEMSDELAQRDITLDQYLGALKGTRYELEKAIRERVVEGLKAELIMDAVASAEGIEISDEEADDFIKDSAAQAGGDPEKVVADTRAGGRIPAIKANMRLSQAVDVLLENAVFKDGTPVIVESTEGAETGDEEVVVEQEPEARGGEPELEAADVGAEIVEEEEPAGEPVEVPNEASGAPDGATESETSDSEPGGDVKQGESPEGQ